MKIIHFFGAIQNVGLADRVFRFLLGLAMIVAVLLEVRSDESIGLYGYVVFIAIYPLMTSILGWDPLYSLFHVKSCRGSGRNQCGTLPYEVEATLGKEVECDEGYDCSLAGNQHAHQKQH